MLNQNQIDCMARAIERGAVSSCAVDADTGDVWRMDGLGRIQNISRLFDDPPCSFADLTSR